MTIWTADRRRALLDEYFQLDSARDRDEGVARRAVLRDEYERGLPYPAIARCPFTKRPFVHSIDNVGIDGLWWQYDMPIRPVEERPISTYFALTGAIRLAGAPEPAPFRRKVGPEVPFVVPRMLLHPDVTAVVSQIKVGLHTAYPVVYFADPIPPLLARFNDWGASLYVYESDDNWDTWDSVDEAQEELDFDLVSWIETGKLFWIAPGDAAMALRTSVPDCPFLNLPGERSWQSIASTDIAAGDIAYAAGSSSTNPPE